MQAKLDGHMSRMQLQLEASDVLEDLHNARHWVQPGGFLRRSYTHHGGMGATGGDTGSGAAPLVRAQTAAVGLAAIAEASDEASLAIDVRSSQDGSVVVGVTVS